MGDEVGLHTAGLAQELVQTTEQLVVGEELEGTLVLHERTIGGTLDGRGLLVARSFA